MSWLEIAVAADDEAVEAVAEVLRQHGHGIAIEEPFVQPRIDESPERDFSRRPTVKTYIPDDAAAPALQRTIEEALWHLGQIRQVEPLPVRRLAEEDWAHAWKAYFPVLRIGKRTVVVPAWRRHRRAPGEITVRLDPGLAFGTGMHPTTRLCLILAEDTVGTKTRVLDVGCGSGILSIAAARLGAPSVTAIDVDPVAVGASRATVRLNRLSRRIRVLEGAPSDLLSRRGAAGSFDVVLANITARVNSSLASAYAALLSPGGSLIASGILAEAQSMVSGAFADVGFSVHDVRKDGDWVAILARAPDGARR
ncbi:MAG TPA: 50S ribosomal protein L11 methyltransferase [Chloroflexota bacterium]|nr:50S ribosomal protein L11 methyltransferase [Chloroflexota bacterium]